MSRWLDAARKPSDRTGTTSERGQSTDVHRLSGKTEPPAAPDNCRTERDKNLRCDRAPAEGSGRKPVSSEYCHAAGKLPLPYKQGASEDLSLKSVLSVGVEGDAEGIPLARAAPPQPAEMDPAPLPDPTRAGRVCTWTGRVVSLDGWRKLSAWDRHGPNGRQWNGQTASWEWPKDGDGA